MTITEKALADLLLKYFTTLEPVSKGATLKNDMKRVAQPDGSTKVEMVPTKGDAYLPKDLAKSLAMSISKALKEHLPRIKPRVYRKGANPITASGVISPSFAPTFITDLNITITADEGDFAQVHLGTRAGQQLAAVEAKMYLGFSLDGTDNASRVKTVLGHLIDGQIEIPLSVTYTIGPLSKGTHVIRPYCAKYVAADTNWTCLWPFCHVLVFPGESGQ
jgi:hypothetical protein